MTFVPHRRPQSTPAWRPQPAARALISLVVLAAACPLAAPARAQQTATVRRDGEVLLSEPGGKQLGRLAAGAVVATQGGRGGNTQVMVEGWIFRSSVQAANQDGHTLAVSRDENLRVAPNGRLVARLVKGALLDAVDQRGAWLHVRRSGWVAGRALAGAPATASSAAPAASDTGTAADTGAAAQRGVLRRQVRLYRAPDAPATGVLEAGVPVRVTARAGGWVRVEASGWVRASEVGQAGGQAVSGVTAAELRSSPEEWRGKVLRWTIQFIALQTADELRPDFAPGQRYILARGPAPEYAFVYVIVPPEKLAGVARLQPLDSVTVLARVKSGRSAYLANPILELLDVVP
jgi:hypothetical protein